MHPSTKIIKLATISVSVRPDDADATISVDCLRISFSQELQLVLYRHWTLFDSLCHTEYTACKFCVWTSSGRRLLREFLACMGLVFVILLEACHLLLCPWERWRSIVMSMSVCPWVYLWNYTCNLYQFSCACCLWPWLGPPPPGHWTAPFQVEGAVLGVFLPIDNAL